MCSAVQSTGSGRSHRWLCLHVVWCCGVCITYFTAVNSDFLLRVLLRLVLFSTTDAYVPMLQFLFWKGSSSLYRRAQGCAVQGCSCPMNICMSGYLILGLFNNFFQSFLITTDILGKLLITESSRNFSWAKILYLHCFLSDNLALHLQESSFFALFSWKDNPQSGVVSLDFVCCTIQVTTWRLQSLLCWQCSVNSGLLLGVEEWFAVRGIVLCLRTIPALKWDVCVYGGKDFKLCRKTIPFCMCFLIGDSLLSFLKTLKYNLA